MLKWLILDDMESRHIEFIKITQFLDVDCEHVWNASEAISRLKNKEFDVVWLDHDLSDEHYSIEGQANPVNEGTGAEVAEFIATMKEPPKRICIHSWNPVGVENMCNILKPTNTLIYVVKFGMSNSPFGDLVRKLAGDTNNA